MLWEINCVFLHKLIIYPKKLHLWFQPISSPILVTFYHFAQSCMILCKGFFRDYWLLDYYSFRQCLLTSYCLMFSRVSSFNLVGISFMFFLIPSHLWSSILRKQIPLEGFVLSVQCSFTEWKRYRYRWCVGKHIVCSFFLIFLCIYLA